MLYNKNIKRFSFKIYVATGDQECFYETFNNFTNMNIYYSVSYTNKKHVFIKKCFHI
jgi:hypothetical protein